MNADRLVVNEEVLKRDEVAAMDTEKIQQWLEGKTVRKVIVVPETKLDYATPFPYTLPHETAFQTDLNGRVPVIA